MLELTLIRHGETDWNVARRIQGSIDIGLNAIGRAQAAAAGRAVGARHAAAPYDCLIASDLERASDTAAAIAGCIGLGIRYEPLLRERCFGVFEGRPVGDIAREWPDDWARWQARDPGWGPRDGETLAGFDARVRGWMEALAVESAAVLAGESGEAGAAGDPAEGPADVSPGESAAWRAAPRHEPGKGLRRERPVRRVIAVTHGGVLDLVFRVATGLPLGAPRRHDTLNAAINVLAHDRHGWRLVSWSDTNHLSGAGDDL